MSGPDRGALTHLKFDVCERGFMLRSGGYEYDGGIGKVFAFDRIEDLAAWLVEQYGSPVDDCPCKHGVQP